MTFTVACPCRRSVTLIGAARRVLVYSSMPFPRFLSFLFNNKKLICEYIPFLHAETDKFTLAGSNNS